MKRLSATRITKAVKTFSIRTLIAGIGITILATGINPAGAAAALSIEQQRLFNKHILMFNWKEQVCGGIGNMGGTGGGLPSSDDPSIWNSGLQPPYILEQFMIEVLKAVATKMGAPTSSAVTEEHAIALVAFALGEGGDIMNGSIYNPLNSGYNGGLVEGVPRNDGVQAYKSFDMGVEATARTMVGSFQVRLAQTLINPTSTAEQFMEALTYFKRYQGNKFWAAASVDNPDAYYRQRLSLVDQVRARYSDIAGLIIGTEEHEQAARRTDVSKLVYGKGGGPNPSPQNPQQNTGCSSGGSGIANCDPTFNSLIAGEVAANAAKCLSWEVPGQHPIFPSENADAGASKAKPNYPPAVKEYNPTVAANPHTRAYSDCGVFTATVARATMDPTYHPRFTPDQMTYVRNNPKKWKVETLTSAYVPQKGDILISPGHTFMFVGSWGAGGKFNTAQASLALSNPGTPPEASNYYVEGGYIAARYIGGDKTNIAPPNVPH
jgi:hypothetical protein